MKKIILCLLVLLICEFCITTYACNFFSSKNIKKQGSLNFEILPTMSSISSARNQVWVGTFQLVWNDLIDEFIKSPVEFVGYKSDIANDLNKREFNVNDLSDSAYYKKWGAMSPELKKEIERGIKEKFNETSDILNRFNWAPAKGKYLLYAMLKKDFEYIEKFNKLPDGHFVGSAGEVKFFGLEKDSTYAQRNSIQVMFYNNPKDFAVLLKSKQGDLVYLYRTDDDKTMEEYYKNILEKEEHYSGSKYFNEKDRFKAPILDFKSERTFDELCNRPIKNSDYIISEAIETVQFKMDEAGVKLKSEAAIAIRKIASVDKTVPRYFYFDNKYIIFVSEQDKKPYFGMKITDAKSLQK